MRNKFSLQILQRIPSHLIVAASAWLSRITYAIVQLIVIRILMKSLGSEQYAVFALLTGLITWFMLADFGIGFSLQNFISESKAYNKSYDGFVIISVILCLLIFILLNIAFYFLSPLIGPVYLRSFGFLNDVEKARYFFSVAITFISAAVGSVMYKIWYAEQRGWLANLISTITSLITLIGIWAIYKSELSEKLLWSLMFYIGPVAVLPIAFILYRMKNDYKKIIGTKINMLSQLLRRSAKFWGFAVMSVCVLNMDYVVISQFLKANDIIVYSITTKVFGLCLAIYGSVLSALWPICTELATQKDWERIVAYAKRYIIIGTFFMLLSSLLFSLFSSQITELLSPKEKLEIPILFIGTVTIYQILRVWTDTFAMVLQSMSDLRVLWVWVPLQALISIACQWFLVPIYGIYGVMFGLIASFILTVSWVLPIRLYRYISEEVSYEC